MLKYEIIFGELYNRLNKKPDAVVKRFHELNKKKHSLLYKICPFGGKLEINLIVSRIILSERNLLKNYYKTFSEKEGAYVYTFHETEKEVKKFCEDMNENVARKGTLKYMAITKKEYKRIRKNQDLKFLGI